MPDDPFIDRNVVFGVQDSLISTCGLVVGIAASGMKKHSILTTGFILVLVEALSMSFGSFLSEDSFMISSQREHTPAELIKYSAVMLASYMAAGVVPMLPFIISSSPSQEDIYISVFLTLVSLYLLVLWIDRPKRNHKKAATLTAVGATILAISVFVGHEFKA